MLKWCERAIYQTVVVLDEWMPEGGHPALRALGLLMNLGFEVGARLVDCSELLLPLECASRNVGGRPLSS